MLKRSRLLVLTAGLIGTVFCGCTVKQATQFIGSAAGHQADTQVKYGEFQCHNLRQQCVQGDFQEWETSNKELGCSCKKL